MTDRPRLRAFRWFAHLPLVSVARGETPGDGGNDDLVSPTVVTVFCKSQPELPLSLVLGGNYFEIERLVSILHEA